MLLLLHKIIPPVSRIKAKGSKQQYKPSIKDSQEAFLLEVSLVKTKFYYDKVIFPFKDEYLDFVPKLEYKGTLYKCNFFIYHEDLLKIIDIFLLNNEVYLVLKEFISIYNEKLLCHIVKKELEYYLVKKISDINTKPFNIHKLSNGQECFRINKLNCN